MLAPLVDDVDLGARVLAAAFHTADKRVEATADGSPMPLMPHALARILGASARAVRVLEKGAVYRLHDAAHAPGRALTWAAHALRLHGDAGTLERLSAAWQPRSNQSASAGVPLPSSRLRLHWHTRRRRPPRKHMLLCRGRLPTA